MPTYGHHSSDEAREQLAYLLPKNDVSKPVLGALARAIEVVHDVAPKMWSVTLSDRVVRLNFGPVEVFVIARDGAWFPILGGARRRIAGVRRERAPHVRLGAADRLIGAPIPIAVAFEDYEAAFRAAVGGVRASYTTDDYLNAAAKRAHSRGLLLHLDVRLGVRLPRPAWERASVSADHSAQTERAPEEVSGDTFDDDEVEAFERASGVEGRRVLRTHLMIERSARAVRDAKARWLEEDPTLSCEACGFSSATFYGHAYCEAHHRLPLSTLEGPVETTLSALARLCANCHRAIHRHPEWTVETLAAFIRERRG